MALDKSRLALFRSLVRDFRTSAPEYVRQRLDTLCVDSDRRKDVDHFESAIGCRLPPIARELLSSFDFREAVFDYVLYLDCGDGYQTLIERNSSNLLGEKYAETGILIGCTDGWLISVTTNADEVYCHDLSDESFAELISSDLLALVCAAIAMLVGWDIERIDREIAIDGVFVGLQLPFWKKFRER